MAFLCAQTFWRDILGIWEHDATQFGADFKNSFFSSLGARTPTLRGAWRDHCFPEPFSCFLHKTGLESLKITSACCFLLKCQRKDSKKAKEHRQFRGVLGRWRTAAINRTTFHACQRCQKRPFSQFLLGFGVSFGEYKPFVTSNASF